MALILTVLMLDNLENMAPEKGKTATYVSQTEIRSMFSEKLSTLYKADVPLYSYLIDLISEANTTILAESPELKSRLNKNRPA